VAGTKLITINEHVGVLASTLFALLVDLSTYCHCFGSYLRYHYLNACQKDFNFAREGLVKVLEDFKTAKDFQSSASDVTLAA
jgi:hypothetical protein